MKFKLTRPLSTAFTLWALITGLAATAQSPPGPSLPPPVLAPAGPNLFQQRLEQLMKSAGGGATDPSTGLPAPLINPEWKDPAQTLPEIMFADLPVSEVAKTLRDKFKNAFDIVIPNAWQNPASGNAFSPGNVSVKLELKNVTATEIFNAMNLEFEAENTPVRWELKMNVSRPLAVLRVVPSLVPGAGLVQPRIETVYFVGDLVDASPFGGGTGMESIFNTVASTYDLAFHSHENELQYHKDAQLIIVTAPVDRSQFVQQTLAALREKRLLAARQKPEAPAPKKPEGVPAPNQ